MDILTSFKKSLFYALPLSVVKYKKHASVNETLDTRLAADMYISAKLEQDSFISYKKFSISSLEKAGFSFQDAQLMSIDKARIPYDKREAVIKYEREKVVSEYVEGNNYYRVLAGLPDIGDEDFIYLEDNYYSKYNIDYLPIHLIPRDVLMLLEIEGSLSRLYDKYKKEYIKFLGERNVDIVSARMADNFSLLYFPKNNIDTFYRDFLLTYDECREYFLSVIYNNKLSNMYDRYDDFIGFTILIMTIQRLITNVFKLIVDRDFFDLETIRLFLESYSVPFIKALPRTQLKIIVKNLNILLATKSTNRVLFDVMSILGFDNFKINQQFLFKQHRLNQDGTPVFDYRQQTDEDGNTYLVENHDTMYELFFKGVDVREADIQSALANDANTEPYEQFIMNDPTWINDQELMDKIYKSDFNYVDTKYLTVNIMYKMHKMLFEVAYIFRMILDKTTDTSKMYVEVPSISNTPLSILDCILGLIILTCEKQDMRSDILRDPSKILSIMGFNFEADLDKIKTEIRANKYLSDELCKYLDVIQFKTPNDVNSMYNNIKDLEELLIQKMNATQDIHVYQAYDNLYRTLLVTRINDTLFKMPNGEIANTYQEYLEAINPKFALHISLLDKESIVTTIDYIIAKLMEVMTSIETMQYMHSLDSYMAEGILKLLRFFKSYTIDIGDLDIVYLMDSRYYNMIRIIGQFEQTLIKLSTMDQSLDIQYGDIINIMKASLTNNDVLELLNSLSYSVCLLNKEEALTHDKINKLECDLTAVSQLAHINTDLMQLSGILSNLDTIIPDEQLGAHFYVDFLEYMKTRHKTKSYNTLQASSSVLAKYGDLAKKSSDNMNTDDILLTFNDKVFGSTSNIESREKTNIKDSKNTIVQYQTQTNLGLEEQGVISSVIHNHSIIETSTSIDQNSTNLNVSDVTTVKAELEDVSSTIRLHDIAYSYDLTHFSNSVLFDCLVNKKGITAFNKMINNGLINTSSNDMYILIYPLLKELFPNEKMGDVNMMLYNINVYIKTLQDLYDGGYISVDDKIIVSKFMSLINNTLHLVKGMTIDKAISLHDFKHMTIKSDTYSTIYTDIKTCNKYVGEILYNMLTLYSDILDTLPELISVANILTIHSAIFKDTTFSINLDVLVDLGKDYAHTKLEVIFSELDRIRKGLTDRQIIEIGEYYDSMSKSTTIRVDLFELVKVRFCSVDPHYITMLCSYMSMYSLNLKDILRILSVRSIYDYIIGRVNNSIVNHNVISITEIRSIIDTYKCIISSSKEVINMNHLETSEFETFMDYSLVVISQIEYYLADISQNNTWKNISTITKLLKSLEQCMDSIVLGFDSFIDSSLYKIQIPPAQIHTTISEDKLNKLRELSRELRCNIAPKESISLTSTIKFIR